MSPYACRALVGRTAELQALGSAFSRAQDGQLAVTLLVGDAGVGKSRLVREHADAAAAAGAVALSGDCVELSGGEFPYAPIGGVLRHVEEELLQRVLAECGAPVRAEIARVFPDLTRAEAEPPLPGQERFAQPRLFGALLAILGRLAEHAPLLLVIEDVQWADDSSRDFLRYLVHNTLQDRLSLVLTVRGDDLLGDHPVRAFILDLCRDDRVERIEVAPLRRRAVEEQLACLLGHTPALELLDTVFARAQGNPFYTEELLAAGAGVGDALPATLRDSLLLRVEALSAPAQQLLRALAAIARPAEPDLLTTVSELSETVLEEALTESMRRNLVTSDPRSGNVAFRHALLREAVYSDLLPFARRRVHARIAAALEAGRAAETAPERAFHWDAAGDAARSLPASVDAGLQAERVFAYAEALTHYERARRLWPHPLPEAALPLDWVELTSRAAEAARFTGDYARAVALGKEALAGVDQAAERARAARLYGRLGRYQVWEIKASLDAFENALAALVPGPTAERARLESHRALAFSFMPDWEQARTVAEQALATARAVGAAAEEGSALVILGGAHAFLGDQALGEAEIRSGLALAAAASNTEDVCRAHIDLAEVLRLQGRVGEALESTLEGEALAARLGAQESFGTFMAVNAAEDLLRLGRWDEVETRLTRLLPRSTSSPPHKMLCATVAGRLDAARGRHDRAREHFEHALTCRMEGGPPEYLPALYAGWAELELWRGDLDAARARIAAGAIAIEGVDDVLNVPALFAMGARVEADHAERARAAGDRGAEARACEAAEAHLTRLAELTAKPDAGPVPPVAEAERLTCEAELARARGAQAAAAWRAAAAAWACLQRPYEEAYAGFRCAEARLLADADREEALPLLQAADAATTALAAAPLGRAVRDLAARARLDLAAPSTPEPAPPAAGDPGLTRREVEVLKLLAEGLTNRQIADQLFISTRTAEQHVGRILSKLDAPNRLVAAATAERLGLLARA